LDDDAFCTGGIGNRIALSTLSPGHG